MATIDLEKLRRLRRVDIKNITGYSYNTLKKWEKESGSEYINKDETWDLIKLFRFREATAKFNTGDEKKDLELEKLRKEIEFKDSQIQKNLRNMVETSYMEQLEASRAATLRNFLETTLMQNLHLFVGKKLAQMRVVARKLIVAAMDEWAGAEIEKR